MKPPLFRYHDPESVADVVALLGRTENAKLLAGGQSLMPMLNMRLVLPDDVIDLNRIGTLAYIRENAAVLEIGAMTRQREIERNALVHARCPLLAAAIAHVGHQQTRNRGTLGGSLCHLDPSAELVAAAMALGAVVSIAGRGGERKIPFAQFPQAYMTPAIAADELVTAVSLPLWGKGHGHAFVEIARRHGDFAVCAVAVMLEKNAGGAIARASITVAGLDAAPVRVTAAEQALLGQAPSDALFRDASECCRALDAVGDVHAPAAYRQHLAAVLAKRALGEAAARCH
jgi:carbon-monoxide dehydrogenase medium subunit